MAALQKQRGGPGRVNSVSSSISCSSDFQLEIPGVSWGQCYRQELVSWSVSPASLITPGPLKYLGASYFVSSWWRDSAMEELWSLPLPVRFSSLPLKVRGNSLILRFVVQYFSKRKPSIFFLNIFFFNISLVFSPLLIYWHVSQSQEKILCMKLYIQYSMSNDVLPSPWSCTAALKFLLRRQQLPTTTLSSVNTGTFKELCQLKKKTTQNNVYCRSSQKYRHFSSACAGEASGLSEPFFWPTLQEFCHFKSL